MLGPCRRALRPRARPRRRPAGHATHHRPRRRLVDAGAGRAAPGRARRRRGAAGPLRRRASRRRRPHAPARRPALSDEVRLLPRGALARAVRRAHAPLPARAVPPGRRAQDAPLQPDRRGRRASDPVLRAARGAASPTGCRESVVSGVRAARSSSSRGSASTPDEIDYVAFDHMHVQDLRPILGTEDGRVPPRFPNATLLVPRVEWDDWDDLHPLQRAWFVRDGRLGVNTARIALHGRRPHARRRRDAPADARSHGRQPDAVRQHRLRRLGRQRERHGGRQLVAAGQQDPRAPRGSAAGRISTSCSTRTRPRAARISTRRWSSRRRSPVA